MSSSPHKNWIFSVVKDNWQIIQKENVWGVRNANLSGTVKKGDRLIFFVKGSRPPSFQGIYEVSGDWQQSFEPLWADEIKTGGLIYLWKADIKQLRMGVVPVEANADNLSFIDNKKYWYTYLQATPANFRKPIDENDFNYIYAKMAERQFIGIKDKDVMKFTQILACLPPYPYAIDILKKLSDEKKIKYNTEFQRGRVWDKAKKQKLIDSILRGYSINTIFLRQTIYGYECLDGQQRLRTILEDFIYDKFPINPKITPEFEEETTFSQLPELLKNKIRGYAIYGVVAMTNDDEETCKIFLRLQEGLPLNAAEKLNAMIGYFRNEILEISTNVFMKKLGINDSRFQHRYITAQAYVLLLKDHIVDVGSSSLHETYVTYSKAKPPASTTEEMRKTLKFLDEHLGEDANMITTSADFISIFLLAKHLMSSYAIEKTMNLKNFLTQFLIKVAYVTSSENEEDAPYFDYQIYRRSSADSRRSIENRFNVILSKFLEANPTLIPKDPVRSFDDWEKLAVYWRDKGICQLQISPDCKKKIPLNEGTVDHKNPHSKGGKTIINNGQWSCVPCNLKKQNKQNSGTK